MEAWSAQLDGPHKPKKLLQNARAMIKYDAHQSKELTM
jgi:hypothetical protein